ncbi:MAG: transporter [Segetibacter sp.]|nr:transporter [Segetibacter sp.]
MKSLYILLLLMTLVPLISQAQEEDQDEMETDRPSLSFTPKTVVKNRFQVEAGFQKQYDKTNGQCMEEYLYPTVFLKYGLTKKLELHVLIEDEGDYEYNPNKHKVASGIEPVQVGFKYNLFEEKGALPNTSIIAGAAFPKLASPDFKSDYVAPAFRLAMQNSLSKKIQLQYNAGVEWVPDDVHAKYLLTLCPQLELSNKLQVFAEIYSQFSSEETPDYRSDAGLLYKVTRNLQFDISGGLGITKSAPDSFFEVGVSFRLPR